MVLVLGSFPPRACGIAVDEPGGDARAYGPVVVARLARDDRASYAAVAALINAHAASELLVQHEYGLFGGQDSEWNRRLATESSPRGRRLAA